jgi:multiple sugar transport system substrate-binding protein
MGGHFVSSLQRDLKGAKRMFLIDRRTRREGKHSLRQQSTTLTRKLIVVGAALAVLGAASGTALATSGKRQAAPTIVVWSDSARVPGFRLYQKTHPNVKLKIVTWDGDGNGPQTLQTKLNLFNRTGKGWPDVVFSQNPQDSSFIASPPYNFAAPLDKLLPASTIKGMPPGVIATCYVDGKLVCLQNDIAQNVLWYNAALMKKFGYSVPTTWEQYRALGLRVAREHPGYTIGALGSNTTQTYLWASRCPQHEPTADGKIIVNLKSPLCTRAVKMLDDLLAVKAVTPLSEYSPGYTKQYAAPNKILMLPGASWMGEFMFHQAWHSPAGQIAAAPPLRWAGESKPWTGQLGGGIYMVSRHAADQKAAADVVNWMVTSPTYQLTAGTYPAFQPLGRKWLAKHEGRYYASPLGPAFRLAAASVWPKFGYLKFSESSIWTSVVVPVISKGGTIASVIDKYGNAIEQQAKINGYQVTHG